MFQLQIKFLKLNLNFRFFVLPELPLPWPPLASLNYQIRRGLLFSWVTASRRLIFHRLFFLLILFIFTTIVFFAFLLLLTFYFLLILSGAVNCFSDNHMDLLIIVFLWNDVLGFNISFGATLFISIGWLQFYSIWRV